MPTITDFELLTTIYREIGNLKDIHTGATVSMQTELRLFIQESRWHRQAILERLDKLEKRKLIDWSSILKNGWTQIIIFLLLAASNVQLLDAAKLAFKR